jgi:hypothetical protein
MVKCHGSLCVIVGGAASFEVYGSGPAKRTGAKRMLAANAAPERKNNFVLMWADLILADTQILEK